MKIRLRHRSKVEIVRQTRQVRARNRVQGNSIEILPSSHRTQRGKRVDAFIARYNEDSVFTREILLAIRPMDRFETRIQIP